MDLKFSVSVENSNYLLIITLIFLVLVYYCIIEIVDVSGNFALGFGSCSLVY